MKKTTIFLLLLFTVITVKSQENYIRVSGDGGFVLNSERDKKMGLGGTIAWLTQDNLLAYNPANYFSISLKAINNPYGEGKFVSSMFNNADDAFNFT